MALINSKVISELGSICSENVLSDVCLANISSWRIGGVAAALVTPNSLQELINLRQYISDKALPYIVIGNTTNLLFSDERLDVILIRLGEKFSAIDFEHNILSAGSAVWVPGLARKAMSKGLSGIEHICGIPGTLGGLVVMNGGSLRKSIAQAIVRVETVDKDGHVRSYRASECDFSYRWSIFQVKDEIITKVVLELDNNVSSTAIRLEMLNILRSRRKKFPRKIPNCGSVFVSDPAMYSEFGTPGKVIEECGLKGLKKGGAQISHNHANFVVNNGGASAKDVIYIINKVREDVYMGTGYMMRVEPKYVSPFGIVEEI